jgi:hypothetical protein
MPTMRKNGIEVMEKTGIRTRNTVRKRHLEM